MDLSRLQELKKKLINDKELMPVWGYFLDHLGDHPEFIDLGERISHEFLETVVPQVAMQMFPRDAPLCRMRLVRLADHHFIHGSVNVGGRVGGVLFFEDAQVGLLAVSEFFPSDETKFARFSGQKFKPPRKPSRN